MPGARYSALEGSSCCVSTEVRAGQVFDRKARFTQDAGRNLKLSDWDQLLSSDALQACLVPLLGTAGFGAGPQQNHSILQSTAYTPIPIASGAAEVGS